MSLQYTANYMKVYTQKVYCRLQINKLPLHYLCFYIDKGLS